MSPRRIVALAAALVAVVPLLVSAAAPPDTAGRPLTFAPHGMTSDRFPAATEPEHVTVTAHDGVELHTRVFRPDTSADPAWLTPVILAHSPYYPGAVRGSSDRSMDLVERFTPKGYTVVLSDVRGTGNSGGCLEQDGPNQARDFRTLVEHFAAQDWSNGRVGSYGKSYDAETQNAGAVLDPDGLETMVTVAGISGLYDVYAYDGVPLGVNGLASAGIYTATGMDLPTSPEGAVRYWQRPGCHVENIAEAADASGDMDTYWAEREFRFGVDEVDASVLYVHGLGDPTVTPIAIDGWYDDLPGFKRAILGQWAHYYPYDAPDEWAREDWYDAVHAWFDHELLGLDTGITDWPAVQVQDEAGRWRAVASAAGMGTEHAYALGPDALAPTDPADDAQDAQDAGVTFAEDGEAAWTTATFEDGAHLSGQAFLDAIVTLDRDDAHLVATLQEVRADGTARDLVAGFLSVRHAESVIRGMSVTPGYPVPYRIRTQPFDATLDPGSSLRLVLSGSGQGALPAGNGFSATVDRGILRVPFVERVCGVDVASRVEPRAPVQGCPGGIPAEQPRYDLDAARGHEGAARIVGTGEEEIGGVPAVRESGYLTVRDGVEVAFEVVRPQGDGPFPTLLTYDGYAAGADPDPGYAERYLPKGYALAGLSIRGTGCSGGRFDFFQPAEGPDGYEMVEWLAAQPWSVDRIGMIGKSYPGITQLFVAEAQPPHLAAIAPGHYYADVYRDVAFPGGIFNHAFAGLWSFIVQPAPGTQAAVEDSFAGDATCAEHQRHHADNARYNPFVQAQEHRYDDPLVADRSPLKRVEQIDVPVFQALAWQDEQLASRQVHLLDTFDELGIEYRAILSNGDHGMYREGPQLAELDRFFEAHVEELPVLRDGTPRARYLAEPPVAVYWEQGEDGPPRWQTHLDGWPDATSRPLRLYAGPDGTLGPEPPAEAGTDTYTHTAASTQGVANPAYASMPHDDYLWDDYTPPEGASLAYTTAPFEEDTVLLGSASADLWLTATAPNVDFQVTLTEIRPDGQEVYVQNGWLRTSQRALDRDRSTALRPYQTHAEADVQDLSPTDPQLARIEIFPFGHTVREGSRLRLWVEAPTTVPQLWAFTLDPTPAQVSVHRGPDYPSSLVLPLTDLPLPAGAADQPTCGEPLRQPCRPDARPDM